MINSLLYFTVTIKIIHSVPYRQQTAHRADILRKTTKLQAISHSSQHPETLYTTFSESVHGVQSARQCCMTSPANTSVPQPEPRHCIHAFRASYAAHRSDLCHIHHCPTTRTKTKFSMAQVLFNNTKIRN